MTHDQRRQVKAANFAIIYGGSAKTLVKQAGIEPSLAKQLVAAFYKRYPGVQSWQQSYASVVNNADKDLEGVTDSGWPRHIVSMSTDTKRMLVYKEYDNPWGGVSYSPTEMKNYPVQSLATGDIVPLMIGILFRELCKAGLYDTVHLVNTVHDSIILDVHIDSLKEAVGLCKSVLENVPRYLEEVFDIKTTLPFKVEITAGKNWKEQEDIDKVI
jgi:DNA polymerase-1